MHSTAQECYRIVQFNLVGHQPQHEIQRLVLVPANHVSVEIEENQGRQNCRPFVAIDESMIQYQRVQQGGSLADQVWISISPESAGFRPGDGRVQEPSIPQRPITSALISRTSSTVR